MSRLHDILNQSQNTNIKYIYISFQQAGSLQSSQQLSQLMPIELFVQQIGLEESLAETNIKKQLQGSLNLKLTSSKEAPAVVMFALIPPNQFNFSYKLVIAEEPSGLPSIGTGVKDTETLVQNTNSLVCVCRVVIGIVTLTHCETGLEI